MNHRKFSKPDNISDQAWQEHLRWMSVGGAQLDANFARHLARVKEDASRCEELLEQHRAALAGTRRRKSLFND
jgi:hypothetical protein